MALFQDLIANLHFFFFFLDLPKRLFSQKAYKRESPAVNNNVHGPGVVRAWSLSRLTGTLMLLVTLLLPHLDKSNVDWDKKTIRFNARDLCPFFTGIQQLLKSPRIKKKAPT